MQTIKLRTSKHLHAILGIISGIMAILGVVLLFLNEPLIGILMTCSFGVGSIASLINYFDDTPILIMDSEGLTYTRTDFGKIAWTDIQDASLFSIRGTRFIALELKNKDVYLQRRAPLGRFISYANPLISGAKKFNISLSGVQGNPFTILNMILERSQKKQTRKR